MSDQIVVVTGAAGALGSTLVRTLAARGDPVAALDVPRAHDALQALAGELGALVLPLAADVSSAQSWASALSHIEARLGTPTAAALIAGGWAGGAPLHATSDDDAFDRMRAANLDTVHRSLRALLPGMVSRQRGSVVVVGSRAVERPWESAGAASYAASKAAVVAMARVAAAETIDHGVRINAVLPSVIDTPANRAAMADADPGKWVSQAGLVDVIAFLLSDAAREVTGAAIPVYGRV
ncbi:MAG: SDR family NAD(P)-dependent oxidoreductase [Deltaproteobacteria bacterium]|nr:SDR family NAD(P)-dependent oxidoreductase [Deltaproteobacteria bacterium]